MGGDFGPSVVIPAAALSLIRHPDTHYIFFGRESEIRSRCRSFAAADVAGSARRRGVHGAKPSQASATGAENGMACPDAVGRAHPRFPLATWR
jgi:glycerol-3-phosphate acyltransferase PlsX